MMLTAKLGEKNQLPTLTLYCTQKPIQNGLQTIKLLTLRLLEEN